MAWNPNIPTVTNRVQDDLNAIRENFQHLDQSRIVEMGSNANGEYVRWENGLQACWLFGEAGNAPLDIQPGGNGTFRWFYPAQFSIVPKVFGSPNQRLSDGGGRIVVIDRDISAVSADGYRYHTVADTNTDGPLSLLAIGRWK